MKVILYEDIPHLGKTGDIVNVTNGYARNYLVPKQLAVQANPKNVRQIEHQKKLIEQRQIKMKQDARTFASRLESISITIARKAGEQDKLYGSVGTKDVKDALKEEGIIVDRKNIILEEPIKSLGVYTVDIKFHTDVIGKLKVWVVAE